MPDAMPDATILIADDSAYVRNSLKGILEQRGYEVVALAENGLEAVSKYKAHRPSLVLLDIIMPQLDGLNALRLLRQLDPQVRAVMITSISTQASVADCANAGAKSYVLKPFDARKVLEVVEKALLPEDVTGARAAAD
jgi:two-component system chemotaxis response regulator CheY